MESLKHLFRSDSPAQYKDVSQGKCLTLHCFNELTLQQLIEITLMTDLVVSGGRGGRAGGFHLQEKVPGDWALRLDLQTLRLSSEAREAPEGGHSGW